MRVDKDYGAGRCISLSSRRFTNCSSDGMLEKAARQSLTRVASEGVSVCMGRGPEQGTDRVRTHPQNGPRTMTDGMPAPGTRAGGGDWHS